MFEKEAEEYLNEHSEYDEIFDMVLVKCDTENAFKDGAEFGYNKANEWHDLRKDPNDLPKENELYLVFGYTNKREKFYELDVFDPKEGEFLGCGEYVYAWCEIPQFKGE